MAVTATATIVFSRSRTNKPYRQSLETLPGFIETTQLRAALLTAQQTLPGVPVASPPETADDIPEWLDAVAASAQAEHARTIKYTALASQINQADGIIETLVIDGTDELLTHLHNDALMPIMGKVMAIVDKLRGAVDAQSAIALNVSAEWRKLTPLVSAYTTVRSAQSWALGPELVSGHTSQHPDAAVNDLVIANLDDVWPNRGHHVVNFGGGPQQDSYPWPDDETELLIWLASSGAKVWIPTTVELAALHRERRNRANQPADLVSANTTPTATLG